LSHGWATEVIRQHAPGAEVGITLIFSPAEPATNDAADSEAARRLDGSFNRWYIDPIYRGRYPEDAVADRVRRGHLASADLPFVRTGDLETISTPIDFLGVNYYSRTVVRAGDGGEPVAVRVVPEEELTDMGWEVYPQGLYDVLVRIHREYQPAKIYVTENGAAYADGPDDTGRVADTRRIDYMRGHLKAGHRAIEDGVPLRGYFAWSLLDNFEWALGYEKRFGLFWVDFESQQRIAKDSASWYRDVATANAMDDD
jgi:beta-glucosidase